jgi:protein-tyrosine phosphatase
MIDLHNHLLPGLDDGPSDTEGALAMARAAVAAGITTMACTPHVAPKYPNSAAEILAGVERLTLEIRQAGIDLRIVSGAEISTDVLGRLDDDELRALSLNGTGWLLVEPPFAGWPVRLPKLIGDLEMRGFRVLVAHPERAEAVQHNPDRLRDLVGRGALVQSNASSFTGGHGKLVAQTAKALLRNELVHILASDAHSATWRPPGAEEGLRVAARELGVWPEQLEWMIETGPRQIILGDPVRPPRLVPRPSAREAGAARPEDARRA